MIESFWAVSEAPSLRPLKKRAGFIKHGFKTRDEARLAIFEYIEVYCQRSAEVLPSNRERLHSSLLYQTPHGFELAQLTQRNEVLIQKAA